MGLYRVYEIIAVGGRGDLLYIVAAPMARPLESYLYIHVSALEFDPPFQE